jgi:hypothetical protein
MIIYQSWGLVDDIPHEKFHPSSEEGNAKKSQKIRNFFYRKFCLSRSCKLFIMHDERYLLPTHINIFKS